MKAILSLCLFIVLLMPGCAAVETTQPENNALPLVIEHVDIKQLLRLQEDQEYDIFDYQGDTVLVLISDLSKQNPLDINDQTITTFYESFVLFDLSSKEAKKNVSYTAIRNLPKCTLIF